MNTIPPTYVYSPTYVYWVTTQPGAPSVELPPGFVFTPAMVLALIKFLVDANLMSELVHIWGSGGAPSPEAIAAFKQRLEKLGNPDSYYATPPKTE